jgi:hypothetical protein
MEILLVRDRRARCWMAEYDDEECDEGREVIALFGTHRVPTPFTPSASGQVVKAYLEKKNPGWTVTIGHTLL